MGGSQSFILEVLEFLDKELNARLKLVVLVPQLQLTKGSVEGPLGRNKRSSFGMLASVLILDFILLIKLLCFIFFVDKHGGEIVKSSKFYPS